MHLDYGPYQYRLDYRDCFSSLTLSAFYHGTHAAMLDIMTNLAEAATLVDLGAQAVLISYDIMANDPNLGMSR